MAEIDDLGFTRFLVKHVSRRAFFSCYHATVNSRQTYGMNAPAAKLGQYLGIYLAAKYHLGKLQGVIICHTSTFDNGLYNAEFLRELGQLFPASVDHANANTDLVQQRKLLGKRCEVVLVLGHLAGKL